MAQVDLPRVLILLIGEILEDPRVLKTCKSLLEHGAEVTAACTNPSGKIKRENRFGINIIRFPHGREFILKKLYNLLQGRIKPGFRRVISQIHEEVPASPVRAAVRNTVLSMNFRHSMRNSRKINRLMINEFKGKSFDLVHCNDVDTLFAGSALKSSGSARALLYDAHEFWSGIGVHGSSPNTALRNLEAEWIGNADYVVTVNDFVADMIRKEYSLDAKPSVVMNCPQKYTGPVHTDMVHSPVRVLYQGKVQAFRGLENLVLAFKYIKKAELTVSGYGPLTGRLALLVETEKLADKVHLTGKYDPQEAFDIISDHDIGILPFDPVTLSITYSSPNKLFDYAMGGLAIAASGFPFLKQFIDEEKTGRTFSQNDPKTIADALSAMVSDKRKLIEFKSNARSAAMRKYYWDKQFSENYPWIPAHC